MMQKMVIYVQGYKWFDKDNGNTYCNALIMAQDGMYTIGYQYGYGSHYLEESKKIIREKYDGCYEYSIIDLGAIKTTKKLCKNLCYNEFWVKGE